MNLQGSQIRTSGCKDSKTRCGIPAFRVHDHKHKVAESLIPGFTYPRHNIEEKYINCKTLMKNTVKCNIKIMNFEQRPSEDRKVNSRRNLKEETYKKKIVA